MMTQPPSLWALSKPFNFLRQSSLFQNAYLIMPLLCFQLQSLPVSSDGRLYSYRHLQHVSHHVPPSLTGIFMVPWSGFTLFPPELFAVTSSLPVLLQYPRFVPFRDLLYKIENDLSVPHFPVRLEGLWGQGLFLIFLRGLNSWPGSDVFEHVSEWCERTSVTAGRRKVELEMRAKLSRRAE